MPRSSSAPPPSSGANSRCLRVLLEPLAVVGDDVDDLAQRAVGQQPPDLAHVREEARPHRLHQEELALPRLGDELHRLGGVHRERLLAQHVLARAQGEQRVLVVHRVRRADVDGVDLRIRHERLVGVVAVGDAEALAERLGARRAARADRHRAPRLRLRELGRERRRDASRADDAPADHTQLLTSSTGCHARCPTPWPICCRHDTPVAATSVPGAASRSAGNSRCSPICIERS